METIIPKFRSPYTGIKNRVSISFLDENGEQEIGRTEQCHKNLCSIDNIIRQYDKTGLITHLNNAVANYGDFTEVNEYQDSLNLVMEAQDAFAELPSHIRKKFDYDPGQFFEFATNPENKDELIDLGLAEAPIIQAPIEVNIVADNTAEIPAV